MKKTNLRLIALLLVVAALFTACGQTATTATEPKTTVAANTNNAATEATEAAAQYPEYLNLDSAYPIVKDEYADEITLTAVINMQDNAGEWEDLWICKYLKEKYNINLEVEYTYSGTRTEQKNLMFASNELPDLLLNQAISTSEVVQYGVEEGLFLACDEYINETLTPNLYKYMSDPSVAAVCTATDGHVYTLPQIKELADDVDSYPRVFINTAWLEQVGMDIPETLDEFVDAMYAIKEADPAGVGSDNLYPFGGGMDTNNMSWFLINALGYNVNDNAYGTKVTLRDGQVVIPVYDMEIFQEYLKLMNQFWNDGIIAPTYFTIESTEVNAQVLSGNTAMYNNTVYILGTDLDQTEWASCKPLTSAWQTEPEIPAASPVGVGGFAISANTKYPELCLRIADAFYNNDTDMCAAFYGGYGTGTEWAFDYLQREYIPETNGLAVPAEQLPEGLTSWNYIVQYLNGNTYPWGAMMTAESMEKLAHSWGSTEYKLTQRRTGDSYWRGTMFDNLIAYATESYPTTYYASAEVMQEITDLETVLNPYIKEQVALFITGKRDLSEVDAFVTEMESMGMDRLLELYTDIYADYTK